MKILYNARNLKYHILTILSSYWQALSTSCYDSEEPSLELKWYQ